MGAVVDADGPFGRDAGYLLDGMWERDEARTEDYQVRVLLREQLLGLLGVDVDRDLVVGEVEVLDPEELPEPRLGESPGSLRRPG